MKKTVLLLISLILFVNHIEATHIEGSEISYRPISNGSAKYQITLRIYRNCAGIALDTSDFTCKVRCSSSTSSTEFIPSLSSIKDVTSLSPSSGNCNPPNTFGSGSGIEEHIYLDTIDFGSSAFSSYASCGETIIEVSGCCRDSNLNTGAANANYYNYSSIFFGNFSSNISSSSKFKPLSKVMQYVPVRYFNNQENPDADSLSFAPVKPLSAFNSEINYSSGFATNQVVNMFYFGSITYPNSNPNASTPIGSYFNTKTGDWIFTPATTSNYSAYAIEVTEWRKDTLGVMKKAGITRKDMTLKVENFSNYSLFQNTANSTTSCIGENNSLDIEVKDNIYTAIAQQDADSLVVEIYSDYPVTYSLDQTILSAGTLNKGSLNWNTDSFTNVPTSFDVILRLHSGKHNSIPLFDSKKITINNFKRPEVATTINKLNCGYFEVTATIDTFNNNNAVVTYSIKDSSSKIYHVGFISPNKAKDTFRLSNPGKFFIETKSAFALSCPTEIMDSFYVVENEVYPFPEQTNVLACYKLEQQLSVDSIWQKAVWSTGDTAHSVTVDSSGKYYVLLFDSCNNTFNDSFIVEFRTFNTQLIDTTICSGGNALFAINNSPSISWVWPNNSTKNTFQATAEDSYVVEVFDSLCNYQFKDTFNVILKALPIAKIEQSPFFLCPDSVAELSAVFGDDYQYSWSNNSNSRVISITNTGWHIVNVTNSCGEHKDSIFILDRNLPDIDLGPDIKICRGDSSVAGTTSTGYDFIWNTGDTIASIKVKTEGEFILDATNTCGTTSDSVYVYLLDTPIVYLGPDTAIHQFDEINVRNRNQSRFATYLWNIGSNTDNIDIRLAGDYWLQETNMCGVGRDSINVRYTVGVKEVNNLGLDIYPNPSRNYISINSSNGVPFTFNIIDAIGNVIIENNEPSIYKKQDISAFYKGTYHIQIMVNGATISEKLMIY